MFRRVHSLRPKIAFPMPGQERLTEFCPQLARSTWKRKARNLLECLQQNPFFPLSFLRILDARGVMYAFATSTRMGHETARVARPGRAGLEPRGLRPADRDHPAPLPHCPPRPRQCTPVRDEMSLLLLSLQRVCVTRRDVGRRGVGCVAARRGATRGRGAVATRPVRPSIMHSSPRSALGC